MLRDFFLARFLFYNYNSYRMSKVDPVEVGSQVIWIDFDQPELI